MCIYMCVCVRKRIIAKFMDTNPISTAWTAKRIYISSARDRQRSSSPLKRIYLAGAKFRERPRNSRLRQVYTAAQFDENPSADHPCLCYPFHQTSRAGQTVSIPLTILSSSPPVSQLVSSRSTQLVERVIRYDDVC